MPSRQISPTKKTKFEAKPIPSKPAHAPTRFGNSAHRTIIKLKIIQRREYLSCNLLIFINRTTAIKKNKENSIRTTRSTRVISSFRSFLLFSDAFNKDCKCNFNHVVHAFFHVNRRDPTLPLAHFYWNFGNRKTCIICSDD